MVTEDGLTLGGGHALQCTYHVSQKCALETYMILLTNVSPINLIESKRKNIVIDIQVETTLTSSQDQSGITTKL